MKEILNPDKVSEYTYWLRVDYKSSVIDKQNGLSFNTLQNIIKGLNKNSDVKCINYGRESYKYVD